MTTAVGDACLSDPGDNTTGRSVGIPETDLAVQEALSTAPQHTHGRVRDQVAESLRK
jgi:hypothetical protein